MRTKKPIVTTTLTGGHVYILLEHASLIPTEGEYSEIEACIIGVYSDRESAVIARQRYQKSRCPKITGYLAIIKKPIKGKITMNCLISLSTRRL